MKWQRLACILLTGAMAVSEYSGSVKIVYASETAEGESGQEMQAVQRAAHVTVHDPSIIRTQDGEYYVLGSHTASARSEDLIHWEQVNIDYAKGTGLPFYGNLEETMEVPFLWAGRDDGDCRAGFAVWAPDIIWNPYYEWEDGSQGAYMLYYCTSSTWRRSCIAYMVSKDFTGPYTYMDTIVYSGFTRNGNPDGSSVRDTMWDNDYLNLKKLIEKGSSNGGIDGVSENWFMTNGDWNHNYAPNAIDPNLFFSASGEKLYMAYGSWSGGLFLLELDRSTGEPIYPGVDSVDEESGNYVDRYFGIHLAGGSHESGEGPYIVYDEEAGYYFLYETYGGLTAEGGYNMRLFRSENAAGPYLDAAGRSASESGKKNEKYGIKLIGNYTFFDQIGKRAAGHNSVLIDEDGARYLVYHQRFETTPQLEGHEVRVHQQFLNEDLWPVTAVYEYVGEQPENYSADEVAGAYEFVNHGTKTDGEMLETTLLFLNADGSVSGASQGTWEKTDSGKGYDYVTIQMEENVYKGIFFRQHKENRDEAPVMTFTAIGDDNSCIWGSGVDLTDDNMAVNMAAISIGQQIPRFVEEDLDLPTQWMGAQICWESSEESVITSEGKVTKPEKDTRVDLIAVIKKGDAEITQKYKVKVRS